MHDELCARQTAIRLRLAGEDIESICQTLQRSRVWFHKWWRRYLEAGPEGLYDKTRANHHIVNRTPPHIERAVISIRKRLADHAAPQTRYSLVGAPQIRAELEQLGYSPLPCLRTIERIIAGAGLTCPPLRLVRRVTRNAYPTPQAQDSNQMHQVDFVGPRYLKGDKSRYYFLVCKDRFDQAVFIQFVSSRCSDTVLAFLVRAWQRLGIPDKVQFDNGREFAGFGQSAKWLTRVIRFCLRLGIEPVFIPKAKACYNGSVEQFNGWFQPRLLEHPFANSDEVNIELDHLMNAVNEQHVHTHLGYQTAVQYRRRKHLRRLPADCTLHHQKLPIAVGKVTFIRFVTIQGTVNILDQTFRIGKRLKFEYVKATLDTQRQTLKVYHKGRIVKQFDYPLSQK